MYYIAVAQVSDVVNGPLVIKYLFIVVYVEISGICHLGELIKSAVKKEISRY